MHVRLVFAAISSGLIAIAFGNQYQLPSSATSTPPKVDGVIGDSEWNSASRFAGLTSRMTGAQEPEGGEFFLSYDASFIYFAARLQDSQPSGIRAVEYRTNVNLSGDDNVTFSIDPTGSAGAFSSFTMNAAGGSNLYISGGRAIKREWLGEFESKGRITQSGWEVEAKIPWRLMQLPQSGKRDINVNVSRYCTRTQRESIWAFLSGTSDRNYGVWKGVDVPKVPFERTLKLLPYGYVGYEDPETIAVGGLDFKTSLTETIEAVGTINPDFRNIQGDILSLDFSYLERLANDSRPFFQEGAGYYGSLLFAPQRIDKFDAGLNVYGRLGDKLTFGALATHDFGYETNAVASLTYSPDPRHVIRFSGASRESDLGPDNQSALVRFVETKGPLGYGIRYSVSDDEILGVGTEFAVDTGWSKNGWGIGFNYRDVSEDFMPRLGFVPERDYKGFNVDINYTKPISSGKLMEWGIYANFLRFDHQNGDFYRSEDMAFGSLTMRNGLDFDFGIQRSGFETNRDEIIFFSVERPRGDPYRRWQFDYTSGEVAGKDYRNLRAVLQYRPLAKWQVSLSAQEVKHFDKRRQTILTTNYDLGSDQSISGRLVERDGEYSGYLAWRRSGNRGAEYYVVIGDPNSKRFEGSIILKAVFPFELRL